MGLGSTAKKVQKVVDLAEKTYNKLNEVVNDLQKLRDDFDETSRTVEDIERELAEQRALVEALAERQGIDVAAVREDVDDEVAAGSDGEQSDTETDGERPAEGE
jgi:uncharacterized coiled-coil DUF342 family protein